MVEIPTNDRGEIGYDEATQPIRPQHSLDVLQQPKRLVAVQVLQEMRSVDDGYGAALEGNPATCVPVPDTP
jgi:hypothetical protein